MAFVGVDRKSADSGIEVLPDGPQIESWNFCDNGRFVDANASNA